MGAYSTHIIFPMEGHGKKRKRKRVSVLYGVA